MCEIKHTHTHARMPTRGACVCAAAEIDQTNLGPELLWGCVRVYMFLYSVGKAHTTRHFTAVRPRGMWWQFSNFAWRLVTSCTHTRTSQSLLCVCCHFLAYWWVLHRGQGSFEGGGDLWRVNVHSRIKLYKKAHNYCIYYRYIYLCGVCWYVFIKRSSFKLIYIIESICLYAIHSTPAKYENTED